MGGLGSGRWGEYQKKLTVDQCRILNMSVFKNGGILRANMYRHAELQAFYVGLRQETTSIDFLINTRDMACPSIQLGYTLLRYQEYMRYHVALTTDLLYSGGLRWYFECPISVNGIPCGRRVTKLFLPPGQRYFACRICNALTYKSCQQSHVYDRVYAEMAVKYGTSVEAVKRVFR